MRISALEDELRGLRGKLEEREFETRRLSEELEKAKRDMDFRFAELEKANASATPTAAIPPTAASLASTTLAAPQQAPALKVTDKTAKRETTIKEISATDAPSEAAEPKTPAQTSFDTPRDHYNYAFRLLNQNQYEDASKSLASFTKKYPKDPLVGNAYYWQGETHYIRKDYVAAADNFRQGFEALPNGPKAADNLLKLGMSLSALKKDAEACVVLKQVATKYKTTSTNVAAKAQTEIKHIDCK